MRGVVDGIGDDDPLLIWNGGLWGWFEPELFIRAIDVARARGAERARLLHGRARPPRRGALARGRRARSRSPSSSGCATSHVFFNDWTPYDTRQNVYLDATAAVSFHRAHLETRFSFRTRILDCIWASLPIVCSEGDVLADLVRNEQLGITVPARRPRRGCGRDRAHRDATTALQRAVARQPRRRWRTGTPGARRSQPLVDLARAARRAAAAPMNLDAFVLDERTDPPPGSFASRVPLPLRMHVLGPAKRGLQRARRI